MLTKRYFVKNAKLESLSPLLLLSCVVRHQAFQYRWRIEVIVVGPLGDVKLYLSTKALLETDELKKEQEYLLCHLRELEGIDDYGCKNYQDGKAVLKFLGGDFIKAGVECVATRVGAFEKLAPMDRLLTSPTMFITHSAKDYCILLDLANFNDLETGISPLIYALNRIPTVATEASCEGHWLWPRNRKPFVSFIASLKYVSKIWGALIGKSLNNEWDLVGHVRNGCPVSVPVVIWKLSLNARSGKKQKIAALVEVLKAIQESPSAN